MASTTVKENYIGTVSLAERRGKEGKFQVKVVSYDGKDYEVGKTYKDQVEVGGEYVFNLSKSEYNDKLYYWANLVTKRSQDKPAENKSSSVNIGDDEAKKQAFNYLNSLDKEHKISVIKYLLDRI